MIRMGRSSKSEPQQPQQQANETTTPYRQPPPYDSSAYSPAYSSGASSQSAQRGGALSESETMARDIKEGRLSGFVGHGTVLTGETNFQAMLRVDGHLTGRVSSENGTLIIGSTGRVDANIAVAAASVNGIVNGDIVATERIELGRTARIAGNIQAPRLVIEDGAILEGSCSMVKARENAEKRVAEANSQAQAAATATAAANETSQYLEDDKETAVEAAAAS